MPVSELERAQLLAYITSTDISKARLYRKEIEAQLTANDKARLQDYLLRMESGESVARIVGKRWFWKDEFLIKDTLEPRGDSETLIEAVLSNFPDKEDDLNILDIGTGSGCLILSLLREYKKARGVGIDNSLLALSTAKENSRNLCLEERCDFLECDYREGLPTGEYDIIISNPPYIIKADIGGLEDRVKSYDPYQSLDGGLDGLDAYRSILGKVKADNIFFEIGYKQGADIGAIAKAYNYRLEASYKDLSAIERV